MLPFISIFILLRLIIDGDLCVIGLGIFGNRASWAVRALLVIFVWGCTGLSRGGVRVFGVGVGGNGIFSRSIGLFCYGIRIVFRCYLMIMTP